MIELKAVSRSYGARVAVRSLDLAVPAGQFVAIVGESGSGKTTTLKMTNRLLEPDSGEVLIDGEPTRSQPPHLLRRRIGYVFQRIGLFPHLTVAENIGITPQLLGWPREQIAARVDGAARRWSICRSSSPHVIPRSCPEDSASASASHARSPRGPRSC